MLAIRHGQYDVVDELLRQGAKVEIPNDSEKTLLDLAEQQSNYLRTKTTKVSIIFLFNNFRLDWERRNCLKFSQKNPITYLSIQ